MEKKKFKYMKKVLFPFSIFLISSLDKVYLPDEWGYWDERGIFIYSDLSPKLKMGVLVHEVVEMFLERAGFSHSFSHGIAELFFLITKFLFISKEEKKKVK